MLYTGYLLVLLINGNYQKYFVLSFITILPYFGNILLKKYLLKSSQIQLLYSFFWKVIEVFLTALSGCILFNLFNPLRNVQYATKNNFNNYFLNYIYWFWLLISSHCFNFAYFPCPTQMWGIEKLYMDTSFALKCDVFNMISLSSKEI